MRFELRFILIACCSLLYAIRVNAVPACPYPITIQQPDGSEITVKLHGDEFFHYTTSEDGYILTQNAKGILTYALQDSLGNPTPSNVKASQVNSRFISEKKYIQTLNKNINFRQINAAKRASRRNVNASSVAKKAYPLTGTPKSLVILVNFSDFNFSISDPKTAFTNLLNQTGYSANGGTGSAKDYFNDNSMGVFNPQFDVVGPFTLPQTLNYYGQNDTNGNDINPQTMVIDACTLANNSGLDFSQYDTDKDGRVDNVFIYYAGYNEAEGASKNTVWPHRWSLPNYATKFDGVTVYDYACTSELRANFGNNMCGIGTFCHEFGHVLGLPDYYVTSGADHFTLSYWNIMDSGPYLNSGRTPPAYSAFDRYYLNWMTLSEIVSGGDFTLENLASSNKAYVIANQENNLKSVEFFTFENRQKTGWDSFLPGHGMLITHIYFDESTWSSNTPNDNEIAMGVDIMEADGLASESNLVGDPFPGTSAVKQFYPILRSGDKLDKPITNIAEENGIINFSIPVLSSKLKLNVGMDKNGNIWVSMPDKTSPIEVYNLMGQLIKSVPSNGSGYNYISGLSKQQIYIIKVSNYSTLISL